MEKVLASKGSVIVRRVCALIIDHSIICFVAMIPFYLNFNRLMDDPSTMLNLVFSIMAIGILAYLLKDVIRGRSIGKVLFGLYVRDYEDIEDIPPVSHLILRNILTFIWPVEFIAMLVNKENRKLGDKLGETKVIEYREKVFLRVLIVAILAFVLFVSLLFIGITQIIRNDNSYKTAIKYIESQEDIKNDIGRIIGYGYFPGGSINTSNGHGIAELYIEVKGEKKDLTVFVQLEKNKGSEWEIKDLKY